MIRLDQCSTEDRSLYFRVVAEKLNLPLAIIEKDFWVVWILSRLFSIPSLQPYLTFKGGTSLSKGYGLIHRFSEDVDISIEKKFFGIEPETAPSKKKQTVAVEDLAKCCVEYVKSGLLKALIECCENELETRQGWKLFLDPDDPDQQTILFQYPNVSPEIPYIRSIIKIEIGARSEHWPVSQLPITSYAKEALQFDESPTLIRVLNVERTFWEKATILHQYAHIPPHKPLPPRLSRHYYDFYQLLNSPAKEIALVNEYLLKKVANHKSLYFASRWANYETAKRGTLKLIPSSDILEQLSKDYQLMEVMFFREPPTWTSIIDEILRFESTFNQASLVQGTI